MINVFIWCLLLISTVIYGAEPTSFSSQQLRFTHILGEQETRIGMDNYADVSYPGVKLTHRLKLQNGLILSKQLAYLAPLIGMIAPFAVTSTSNMNGSDLQAWPPTASVDSQGWLLCDGSEHKISDFKALYFALNPTTADGLQQLWGSATAGTFRVPDFRGFWIRNVEYYNSASNRNFIRDSAWQSTNTDSEKRYSTIEMDQAPDKLGVGTFQRAAYGLHRHKIDTSTDLTSTKPLGTELSGIPDGQVHTHSLATESVSPGLVTAVLKAFSTGWKTGANSGTTAGGNYIWPTNFVDGRSGNNRNSYAQGGLEAWVPAWLDTQNNTSTSVLEDYSYPGAGNHGHSVTSGDGATEFGTSTLSVGNATDRVSLGSNTNPAGHSSNTPVTTEDMQGHLPLSSDEAVNISSMNWYPKSTAFVFYIRAK